MLPAVSGPVRFRLNVEDVSHPVLSLADGETNGLRWANLGLLEGSGKFFSGVKPGSRVLAVEPVNGGPVLAERTVGRGRVLGLANTTSWRWALDGGRRGEGPADYQRFWEKTIRWLAGSPGSGSLRLVRPEGVLYYPSFLAHSNSCPSSSGSSAAPLGGVAGWKAAGSFRSSLGTEGGIHGRFCSAEPGNYEWIAEAGEAHRDRLRLDVSAGWEESLDTRPDLPDWRTSPKCPAAGFRNPETCKEKQFKNGSPPCYGKRVPKASGRTFFLSPWACSLLRESGLSAGDGDSLSRHDFRRRVVYAQGAVFLFGLIRVLFLSLTGLAVSGLLQVSLGFLLLPSSNGCGRRGFYWLELAFLYS